MALKARPKNQIERNHDHAETPINELSPLSQDERKLTIRNQLQDQVGDNYRRDPLRKAIRWHHIVQGQRGDSDSLKEIKPQARNAMASKSENKPALIDEHEACPSTRVFPFFALSFQDFMSNPVMTAISCDDSCFLRK